ncbi:putative nuclease HARBI1 [Micropterus dolomieu]|uniref:putative nuclease HARBI1 n=1 Tax=Micropterus dolomieu TaxID=147949 RepID=UPI001E8ECB1D|nr:putative nuclease HARBI1 [Micropterus dolomieu]XP_045887371.1 putative nuclease HARBI1 [Micropterus dolomieu]
MPPHPLTNPLTEQEQRYNIVHACAGGEWTIGQLKGRCRCLDRTGGMLLYCPRKVCRIVQACSVLHSMANKRGIPLPQELWNDEPEPGPQNNEPNAAHNVKQCTAFVRTRPDCLTSAVEAGAQQGANWMQQGARSQLL